MRLLLANSEDIEADYFVDPPSDGKLLERRVRVGGTREASTREVAAPIAGR